MHFPSAGIHCGDGTSQSEGPSDQPQGTCTPGSAGHFSNITNLAESRFTYFCSNAFGDSAVFGRDFLIVNLAKFAT